MITLYLLKAETKTFLNKISKNSDTYIHLEKNLIAVLLNRYDVAFS